MKGGGVLVKQGIDMGLDYGKPLGRIGICLILGPFSLYEMR